VSRKLPLLLGGALLVILSSGCGDRTVKVPPEEQILPTPQHVRYYAAQLPVVDIATGEMRIAWDLRPAEHPALKLGVRQFEARLAALAGRALKRPEAARTEVLRVRVVALMEKGELPGDLATSPSEAWRHPEGYTIHFEDQSVEIVGADPRGAYYGLQTLGQLLRRDAGYVKLRRAEIEDWPTFRLRAFKSQAFEGQMWAMRDALRMASWAPTVKFNAFSPCYTHLPDFLHPPPAYISFLDSLLRYAQSTQVLEIIPEINPYYGESVIEISNPVHVRALTRLFVHSLERGANKLMLQLDDFAKLPQRDRRVYSSLAEANADLLNRLRKSLTERFPQCQLWVCTPVYFHPRNQEEAAYLEELSRLMPQDVDVIWTGRVVTTLCQNAEDIETYQRLVGGRKLVYWDNTLKMPPGWTNVFRCNAYLAACDSPETNDWKALLEATDGRFVGNTYGPSELYKIPLATLADFLWNPRSYDPKASLARAAAHFDPSDPEIGALVVDFANRLHDRVLRLREALCEDPSDSLLKQLESAVDTLARAYQLIAARTRNEVLLRQLQPYVERHTLALPHFRALVQASHRGPTELAAALRHRVIPGLRAVSDRVLKRKGEGEFRDGVFSRSPVEKRNLDSLERLLQSLAESAQDGR